MRDDIDIVDAHHHVWRRSDLPWLDGPMLPRIFGPYEPIRRDYLVPEYRAEAAPAGITDAVYVQANWPLERSVDEVRWLAEVAAEHGWPTAIVGSADLFDASAPETFAAQQAITPLMRGTRLQLHWHENPTYRYAESADRVNDPVLRRNIAALADLGWVFELQVFAAQMADAARLVAAVPDVTFVLVHAGMLTDRDDPAEVAAWQEGMQALAQQPNVVVKLTGQGTFVHRVDPELIGFVARSCLEWFGSSRCMFGTNFPVEKLWTDLPSLVDAWRKALADEPEDVRRDVFAATARRVYRL